MPGMKGRSGGPRENSGGARPGAGRKKKPHQEESIPMEQQDHKRTDAVTESDMLKFLQNVALGITEATPTQVRAAIAAVQYTHIKKGDGGKKEDKEEAARKAGTGKFATSTPPKLVINNSR